jgi:hypothetical protein
MNEYAHRAVITVIRIPIHTLMGNIVAAIANAIIAGHISVIPSMVTPF